MADIFTPWRLGEPTIPNRLVRSATWEGMAQPDGTPTFGTVNFTAELAENGVGLIITGYAFIHPLGRGLPHQTGVHIDAMIGPITRISDAVHKNGGLVAMQIVHAGGQTKSEWIGSPPLAPTAMTHLAFKEHAAELSKEQIADIVGMFARAAGRVKSAGFDAVQLHGAHGYLISEFLSPLTNKRGDEYGGGIDNRARFCLEVYQAVRREVGQKYPVFIKLNTEDGLEGGITPAEAAAVAAKLSEAGIDAIEVSGGMAAAGKKAAGRTVTKPEEEGYFFDNAKLVKAAVKCPVIVVGGWRSKAQVEAALDSVDAVALSRPFIRQPNLAKLWRIGKSEVSTCISCGQCLRAGMKGGVLCVQEQKEKEEAKA
jgi:2,4-dienoyl-CoA reductase-like NADH-dependent reductase (Old Yellow Enzyme family)